MPCAPACDSGRGEVWLSTSVYFVRCHLGTRVALGKPQLQVAFTSKPVRVLIASLSYFSTLPSHFSLAYMYIRAYKLPHLSGWCDDHRWWAWGAWAFMGHPRDEMTSHPQPQRIEKEQTRRWVFLEPFKRTDLPPKYSCACGRWEQRQQIPRALNSGKRVITEVRCWGQSYGLAWVPEERTKTQIRFYI